MKKRTAMIVSLAVGTLMFATTALAEISSKSGYEQLKDGVKVTAESLTEKSSSFTADMSFVLKDNGNVVMSRNSVSKCDVKNNMWETKETNIEGKNKRESYIYNDSNSSIVFDSNRDVYNVTEWDGKADNKSSRNPFKEKEAGDIEKIVDALVANLRDYVVVSQNPDGSKVISGSLNESQIPALINAVVSFQMKNNLKWRVDQLGLPVVTKDIYISEIKGKMVVDKNGVMQSILGTGVLKGKDEQDKEHNMTFEVLGKVSNIDSTVVKKPDLKGKKVEKNVAHRSNGIQNPEMYIGTYKNDIISQKDGKFQKIGERVLEITKFENKTISGRYHEEYKKGFEEYASKARDINFEAELKQDGLFGEFKYSNTSGKSGEGSINVDERTAKIHFYFNEGNTGSQYYDSMFNKVLE